MSVFEKRSGVLYNLLKKCIPEYATDLDDDAHTYSDVCDSNARRNLGSNSRHILGFIFFM
jgi:hypothetical protein